MIQYKRTTLGGGLYDTESKTGASMKFLAALQQMNVPDLPIGLVRMLSHIREQR